MIYVKIKELIFYTSANIRNVNVIVVLHLH